MNINSESKFDDNSLVNVQDVVEGIIKLEDLKKNVREGTAVILRGKHRSVAVGYDLTIKVNVNIGASRKDERVKEKEKIEELSKISYKPDAIMDLSIIRLQEPLYNYAIEVFGGPIGTLPHYLCYKPSKGINPTLLLEEIERHVEAGVAWMTLHPTPTKELYERAQRDRQIPVTSRGGGIVIQDMYINRRKENVIAQNFDDILEILKKQNIVLSVGTTFRPATTVDALDWCHIHEIEIQQRFIKMALSAGVQVMMEGVGHITLSKLKKYIKLIHKKGRIPFVPLGPLPTDAAIGEDHIASAIGASYMALLGGAHMINAVTREEHMGEIPNINNILEGLRAARIAAYSVNISQFPSYDTLERTTLNRRSRHYTCVVEGSLFSESAMMRFDMGCRRCGQECPLLINYIRQKGE